LFEPSKIMM